MNTNWLIQRMKPIMQGNSEMTAKEIATKLGLGQTAIKIAQTIKWKDYGKNIETRRTKDKTHGYNTKKNVYRWTTPTHPA